MAHLTDAQIAINTGWDEALLKLELNDLNDLDFNLDLIGFNDVELAALSAAEESTNKGLTDPDAVPDVLAVSKTKPGDIWLLGRHLPHLRQQHRCFVR